MKELNSMSAAVKEVIDGYPVDHEFYGNQLKDDVVKIYPDAKDMYPDTILRMARRHRRYAFCVVDQNNSLYKKLAEKSIVEQIREVAPKIELPIVKSNTVQPVQGMLFSHFFLVVFLALVLGVGASGVFGFGGRPLLSHCFKYSISSLERSYIAFTPMYRAGLNPCRLSLWFVAPGVVPIWAAISETANNIYLNIRYRSPFNQGVNVKMCYISTFLLYKRIVKTKKNAKISEISFQNLDYSPGRGIIIV